MRKISLFLCVATFVSGSLAAYPQSSEDCVKYFNEEDQKIFNSIQMDDVDVLLKLEKDIAAGHYTSDQTRRMYDCANNQHIAAEIAKKAITAVTTNAPTTASSQKVYHYYELTSAVDVKKSIDLTSTIADEVERDRTIDYIIKVWRDSRMIAAAEHEENLKLAVDSWYANERDWHKVPAETWAKLRDADKGRLKLGIDPEMQCVAPAPAKATPKPAQNKK